MIACLRFFTLGRNSSWPSSSSGTSPRDRLIDRPPGALRDLDKGHCTDLRTITRL